MMQDDIIDRAYKQSKSTQQKQYRDREVDSFADLREAIREMTDNQEAPRTKYETLSKAAQYLRQLNLMNQKLQQQLHALKSSRMNDEGRTMTQNPTVQVPAMSLHRNGDAKSVGTHRTTQIISQSTLHDFYIGMSSGDAAMLDELTKFYIVTKARSQMTADLVKEARAAGIRGSGVNRNLISGVETTTPLVVLGTEKSEGIRWAVATLINYAYVAEFLFFPSDREDDLPAACCRNVDLYKVKHVGTFPTSSRAVGDPEFDDSVIETMISAP
ncbi:hypothetical protein BD769DRAFT_1689457 [Suillus cothurnatus]|nr:hypothetical protein BD769DRAFT_1689457 [Suillus cothurnatus]